jgi:hypothetical protein
MQAIRSTLDVTKVRGTGTEQSKHPTDSMPHLHAVTRTQTEHQPLLVSLKHHEKSPSLLCLSLFKISANAGDRLCCYAATLYAAT